MTTSQTSPVATILVYSEGELIGDALQKLPFLRALRGTWPLAHISWMNPGDCLFAGPALKPLVAPYLNETISHTGIDGRIRKLFTRPPSERRFDLVIDTHRHVLNTLILRRLRHRMFISGAAYFLLSDRKPPSHPYRKAAALRERLFDLIRAASGREPCLAAAPSLPSRFETAARAALPEGITYIGLVPGAGGRTKCWPRERYEALAMHCLDRGWRPVFILGPNEREWIQPLRAIVPAALFPLQDAAVPEEIRASLLFTMAVGRRLSLAVTNDCGTAYMLATVETPLLILCGPTSAAKCQPSISRDTALQGQDFGGQEMEYIPFDAVRDQLDRAIQQQVQS